MLGDMIVNKMEIVDYGRKYGGLNVTQIINDYFSSYFDDKWYLKVRNESLFFGFNPPSSDITTFILRFPIPSFTGKVISVEFGKW